MWGGAWGDPLLHVVQGLRGSVAEPQTDWTGRAQCMYVHLGPWKQRENNTLTISWLSYKTGIIDLNKFSTKETSFHANLRTACFARMLLN